MSQFGGIGDSIEMLVAMELRSMRFFGQRQGLRSVSGKYDEAKAGDTACASGGSWGWQKLQLLQQKIAVLFAGDDTLYSAAVSAHRLRSSN